MISKACIKQLKKTRVALFNTYKRQKNTQSIENNETYLQINDNKEYVKISITDIKALAYLPKYNKKWRVDKIYDSVNETELQI